MSKIRRKSTRAYVNELYAIYLLKLGRIKYHVVIMDLVHHATHKLLRRVNVFCINGLHQLVKVVEKKKKNKVNALNRDDLID